MNETVGSLLETARRLADKINYVDDVSIDPVVIRQQISENSVSQSSRFNSFREMYGSLKLLLIIGKFS